MYLKRYMSKEINRVKYYIDNKINPITGWYSSNKADESYLKSAKRQRVIKNYESKDR